MDIRELLYHLRQEPSNRAVQRMTGVHRETAKRYRVWATEQGLMTGPLPALGELERLLQQTLPEPPPPQNRSSLEPFAEIVADLRKQGVEMTAILQRLQERGYEGSYSSLRRFVRRLEPGTPEVFVRVECRPGEEAQADFGYAGMMVDPLTGQLRRTWAFVMTLSWSRHQYVEFVHDQKLATWLLLHRHAFDFFGGVPGRIVIDNLKAAIVKACFDDPTVQRAYRECAEHYGFLIAPCRPATPRHKGKVESGVHYVKRNFLAGREPTLLTQANQEVRTWVLTTAGQRIHGTTREQPLARFTQTEQQTLHPLPTQAYDLAIWKEATVANDGHITFDNAYYSVPCRFPRGTKVWVRGGAQLVALFSADHQLISTHDRASAPGQRMTHPDHLPPHKAAGLTANREAYQAAAMMIGPATTHIVVAMLEDPAVDRLRTVGRLLALGKRFGDDRLERACDRAVHFDEPTHATVKRILTQGLDIEPVAPVPVTPPARTFARSAAELVGHLFGGALWN